MTTWPGFLPIPITAEAALDGWRERIALVEEEETRHFASLPYITAVAVIGTVGRGTPWPCSDVDLLAVVDTPRGRDAEPLVVREETERNAALYRRGVVNPVEVRHWLFGREHIARDVKADEDAFFGTLEHQHWLGTVLKAQGGRAVHDPDGLLGRFLDRCNRAFGTERFRRLWLKKMAGYCEEALRAALAHAGACNWAAASREILRVGYQRLPCGAYARWGRLPESSSRAVSHFLRVAEEEQDTETARLCLTAARLEEDTVAERFDSLPLEAKRERDVVLAIRRGWDETTDELSVTRDFVNALLAVALDRDRNDALEPVWTGVTDDGGQVRRQLAAFQDVLDRLSRWTMGQQPRGADAEDRAAHA